MRPQVRILIIAGHAAAGLAVALAVWTACGLSLAAHGGLAGPAFAWARPLASEIAGCARVLSEAENEGTWRHAADR